MQTNGDNAPAVLDVPEHILNRGGAMQQVRTQFTTAVAVQRPRSLQQVERRLLEEARLAGEEMYYGWSAGGEKIEGPSVKLALAAARTYGNCAVDTLPVQETADAWIFTASFVDLETGFTLTRQFRQAKKWMVYGRMDEERKDDVRFQLGQSKAIRNVVMNAMPMWLVDKAMEEAKSGVRVKLENFIKEKGGISAAQDLLVKELAKVGVKEEAVLAKFEVAERKALDIDHLVTLRGDLKAIQSGQDRASSLFPMPEAEKAKAAKDKLSEPARQEPPKEEAKSANLDAVRARLNALMLPPEQIAELVKRVGGKRIDRLTAEQAAALDAELQKIERGEDMEP